MTSRLDALKAAGAVLARHGKVRDDLAAAEGTAAVAAAAHYPGHPLTPEQNEARYRELQDQARRKAAA